MRILLADDDSTLRDYVKQSIDNKFDGIVDMASTVSEAIDMIDVNDYDKAIIDLRFDNEVLNGFDILKKAEERGIPERIVFTSVSNQMDLYNVGATAAFRKPLSIKKIAEFLLTNNYDLLKEGDLF